jgi:hypothetical protein
MQNHCIGRQAMLIQRQGNKILLVSKHDQNSVHLVFSVFIHPSMLSFLQKL